MIEIEFSALARDRLHQRIPMMIELERQVLALVTATHEQRLKLDWQCSLTSTGAKLRRHYDKIHSQKAHIKPAKT
ncbi:MAG: hypothetical protein F6K00_20565 [Leptolyngbya sp. SIOISBB]|nr:hypothetical protein [Leptolyngbya sp. SIOISBB]